MPQSGRSGYVVGGIDWPQATVSDRRGNIWVANCGFTETEGGPDSSVTRIAGGRAAAPVKTPIIGTPRPLPR